MTESNHKLEKQLLNLHVIFVRNSSPLDMICDISDLYYIIYINIYYYLSSTYSL